MKKVAIVGGSPSWVDAPFSEESFDIWVLGNQIDRYKDKRVTRIFEIHDDLSGHDPRYAQFLIDTGIPIVVGEKFPLAATNSIVFPYQDIALKGFLTSSPAYMVALAILEGFKHISIYGVDMSVDDHEYFSQQPCMSAWIGYALGLGIEVWIHQTSPLMKSSYIEGIHYRFNKKHDGNEFLEMASLHNQKMDDCQREIREIELKHAAHNGARQAYERLAKVERARQAGQNVSITQTARIK
jgi:hypothetical protein